MKNIGSKADIFKMEVNIKNKHLKNITRMVILVLKEALRRLSKFNAGVSINPIVRMIILKEGASMEILIEILLMKKDF